MSTAPSANTAVDHAARAARAAATASRRARSAVAALLAAGTAALVCGCGGEDDVARAAGGGLPGGAGSSAPAPAPPAATTSDCMPDQAAFDAVLIGSSRASAERRFGCAGVVVDPNLASAGDLMLQWQAADRPERTVQLRFDTTGVFYKTATELDTTSGPSGCLPTQERFDSLPASSNAVGAAAWFGCAGQHIGTVETLGYRDDRYRWGREAPGQPVATVQFANGYVIAKQASGLR